jgi:hypothetical protein
VFVLFGLSYDTQLYIFRIAIWVIPTILFFTVRRVCRGLQAADEIEQIQHQAEQEAAAAQRAS